MTIQLYKSLLIQMNQNNIKLQEIKDKIGNLTNVKSQRISDMPTGSLRYDNITVLAGLIDQEREITRENEALLKQTKILKKVLSNKLNDDKIRLLELYYIDNKTLKEISIELQKKYWTIVKMFSRIS